MNIENFSSFLENPSQLYQLPYQELKSLVLQYPFSANLRLLLLQKSKMENHREYEQNLRMAAIFSINRAHLRQQIEKIEGLTKSKDNVLLQEDFLELKDLSALKDEPQRELIEIDLGEKGEKPQDNIAFNIPNDSGDITTEQEEDVFGNVVTDDNGEMDLEDSSFLLEELLNDGEEKGEIAQNEPSNQAEEDHVLEWEVQEGGQAKDENAIGSEGEENTPAKIINENLESQEIVLDDTTIILDVIVADAVVDEAINNLSAPALSEDLKEENHEILGNEFDELDMIEDLAPKLSDDKAVEEEIGNHVAETTVSWMDEEESDGKVSNIKAGEVTMPGMNKIEETSVTVESHVAEEIHHLFDEELEKTEQAIDVQVEGAFESQDSDVQESMIDELEEDEEYIQDEIETTASQPVDVVTDEDEAELEEEEYIQDEVETTASQSVDVVTDEDELEEDEAELEEEEYIQDEVETTASQSVDVVTDEDELEEDEAELAEEEEDIVETIASQSVDVVTDEDELEEDEAELEEDIVETIASQSVDVVTDEDELEEDEAELEEEEEDIVGTVSSIHLIDSLLAEEEENTSSEEDFFTTKSLDTPFWEEEIEDKQTEIEVNTPEKVADELEELLSNNLSEQEIQPENAILADTSELASDLTIESEQGIEDLNDTKSDLNILEENLPLSIQTEVEEMKEEVDETSNVIFPNVEENSPEPLAKKAFSSWSKHQSEVEEKAKLKKKKKKAKKKAAKIAKAEKKKEAKAKQLAEEARLKKEAAAKEKKALKKSKKKEKAEKKLKEKTKKLKKVAKSTTANNKSKKKKKKNPTIAFANLSIEQSNEVISETFAKVLTMQGEYEEAIKMYEHLKLNIPEKSSYFAKKIKNIKKKL